MCDPFAVKSSRSNAEFPDMSDALKFAVSQGRFVQDPLLEMAYMWQLKGTVCAPEYMWGCQSTEVAMLTCFLCEC